MKGSNYHRYACELLHCHFSGIWREVEMEYRFEKKETTLGSIIGFFSTLIEPKNIFLFNEIGIDLI